MKSLGSILIVLVFFGCTNPKQEAIVSDSTENSVSKTEQENKSGDFIKKPKDFSAFEIQFQHIIKEEGKQILAVSWIADDSIEFRLSTKDQLCGTEYWGNAVNKFSGMDGEIDEDENDEAYSSVEYTNETEEYSLQIRISVDKDKARIVYTHKTDSDTDCIPYAGLLLTRNNSKD